MALPLLPGTEKQYQQLRALMAEGSFVALVAGPPGSGKRTLISRVAEEAGLRTHDFDIESAGMSAAELRAMIAKRLSASQITPDATLWTNIVWVVHNAELLDAHAAVWKSDVTQGLRIILKVHDAPPKLREALKPIYFDRVTDARVAAWAREHLPDADAARIAKMAGGDLRQARAAADMPTGGKDRAGHVHFDTLALVNGGARLDPRQVSTDWVHANMLERCTSIEEAARLSETLALVDTMRCWEGGGAVQAVPDLEADIVQAAVHTARARGKVRFVKGVKKPRETPRPAAWAVRAWRRHRGLRDAVTQPRKRRKRDAPDEATGQSADSPSAASPQGPGGADRSASGPRSSDIPSASRPGSTGAPGGSSGRCLDRGATPKPEGSLKRAGGDVGELRAASGADGSCAAGRQSPHVATAATPSEQTAAPQGAERAAAGGVVSVAAPPEQTTAPLDTERAATGGVVSVAAPPDAEQAAEDDKQNAPSGVSAPSDREASAAHAAGEVFAQSAEAAYLICKGRGGALVPCTAQRVKGEAPELDIEPYVQKSANTTFRRMAWCVLVARGERPALGDAWLELCDTIKSDANNFSMIMADTKKGHVVLLYKGNGGNDKVIKTGKPWEAFKLASKDPLPFAKALLRCVEAIFTINLQEPEQLQRVTALEAIQPYMKMDEIAFKAHMTDLKEQRRLGGRLSPEEEFMVNHTKDMEQLKQLLLKKERMRAMLKDVDSTLRFPWDFTLTPQTLRVFRICPDTLRREVSDRPVDAILDSVGLHTIVFFGAPGKGKTPCAKALASLYSQTNGKTKFVETQTADSLRKLSEFDLLQEGEGVVLDEWQPRREACGPQGGGVEHVKNMLDPADAKTIEARFSDFTLPESCARFVTCQNLGKLLSNFRDLTADTDERQLRALTEEDDDAKAILKRCVFVDVRDHLIRPELRTVHRETRCSKGEALRSTANRARQSEDGHPLSVQLGLWRQVAPGAATK